MRQAIGIHATASGYQTCIPEDYGRYLWLWTSVLGLALQEAAGVISLASDGSSINTKTHPGEKEIIQRRAKRWVDSNDATCQSFLWCCDHLGVNPERIRINYLSAAFQNVLKKQLGGYESFIRKIRS